jgi:trigger factor
MRIAVTMSDNPALAFVRPMLDIDFKPGQDLDLTLRIGPARVFSGAEEPAALLFGGGSMTDQPITIGGPAIAPGFSAQLEGLAPDESRLVEAMLPADHPVSELANQRARYVVTAKALRRPRPLPQDDTLARALGVADIATLEAEVLHSLRRDYDQRARLRLKMALLNALAATADFPVPACLLDVELTQIRERMRAERNAGRTGTADAGMPDDALDAGYRALAERRIRLRLLLGEVARAHDLQVTEEELAQAIRRDAARYPGQERQVLDFYRGDQRALEALRAPLLEEKIVDLLISQATVTEREVTPEELGPAE